MLVRVGEDLLDYLSVSLSVAIDVPFSEVAVGGWNVLERRNA
jgi:hypothetical protein